jgi:hypothetical protein
VSLPDRTEITEPPAGHDGQHGRAFLTIGCFVVFLALVNPLFLASIFRARTAGLIAMNVILSGLLIVLGGALILVGRSRIARERKDVPGQERHSHSRQ